MKMRANPVTDYWRREAEKAQGELFEAKKRIAELELKERWWERPVAVAVCLVGIVGYVCAIPFWCVWRMSRAWANLRL